MNISLSNILFHFDKNGSHLNFFYESVKMGVYLAVINTNDNVFVRESHLYSSSLVFFHVHVPFSQNFIPVI